MTRLFLMLAAVLAIPAVASACPPVQVQAFGVQAYSAPAVQVQAFSVPVYQQAVVQQVAYPVQVLALGVNDHCSSALNVSVRARRQPVRAFFRNRGRANVRVNVGAQSVCY